MDLILDEQQKLLRDTATRLAADIAKRHASDGQASFARQWEQVKDAGLIGLLADPAHGGLGLDSVELALICEQAGRFALRLPLAEAMSAALALSRGGRELRGSDIVLPALAVRAWRFEGSAPVTMSRDGATLSGVVPDVPYAGLATHFLVNAVSPTDEELLCLVDRSAAGVDLVEHSQVDGTVSADLVLSKAALGDTAVLARGPDATEILARLGALLELATSAELLGLTQAALDLTLEHVKLREQFGKPLGSFQALQHRLADVFVAAELDAALIYRVCASLDAAAAHPAMICAAKARSSRTALKAAREALQMHGAIGYTDAHAIGGFYKRAVVLAARYGDEILHSGQFSALTVSDNATAPAVSI